MLSSKLCLCLFGVSTIQSEIIPSTNFFKGEQRTLENIVQRIDDKIEYQTSFLSDDYYQLIYKQNLREIIEKSSASTVEEERIQKIKTLVAIQQQLIDSLGTPKNLNEEKKHIELYDNKWQLKNLLDDFYQLMAERKQIEQNKFLQDWITENIFYLVLFDFIFSVIMLILFYILCIEDLSYKTSPYTKQSRTNSNSPKGKRYKKKSKKSKNQHILKNPSPISTNRLEDDTDADDCLICLDILQDNLFYLEPCGHEYHRECIKLWVVKEGTCPKCRAVAL